jgi:anti-sigma factor RsiW
MTPPDPTHASELDLHRLLLGDLPPEARARIEAHTRACPRCAQAMAALASAQETFDRQVYPRTASPLAERAAGGWWVRARWRWPALAGAAALVLLGVGLGTSRDSPIRRKGASDAEAAPALEIHARRGENVFPVGPGVQLRAGDAIRFVVRRPPELAQVLVAGVDATGRVTVYHPYGEAASARLPDGPGRVELPGSIVLDGSAEPERIFAFFDRRPFALASVSNQLAALGSAAALRARNRVPAAVAGQASVLIERAPAR